MSRSGYSDDCEYLNLWRANVERSLYGKRGQVFLRDLIEALESMPNKRLIRNSLIETTGEVCAIGALGLKRGVDMTKLDPEEPQEVGKAFKVSSILAQEVVYENDEKKCSQTPEERWTRMHEWATGWVKLDQNIG